ncbi:MAG: ABC transporter ATP-binding protein [Bacillota bacterium]|jgi:branched-chain amino acid transport system ATP-binding protein|nr:ABC transporter ATP-binding protein [Bacillota bacterium]
MLQLNDVHVYYGGIHAIKGISFTVPKGKIVSLIGANGAGKSTILRTIVGLVQPRSGSITFQGESLQGRRTDLIVKSGITMVPEGRRIFPNLTVKENLRLGAFPRDDDGAMEEDLAWVYELFPRLKEREWQKGGTLSGGEQQMLAVGRALMSRPSLLMMDEPSLGLAPKLVQEIFEIIRQIHQQGVTILLIEQNALAALRICDYGYVLETGSIIMHGTGQELLQHQGVRRAYLGIAE